MYVEQKPSGALLVKKLAQKKLTTKIGTAGITPGTLLQLTKKECAFLFSSPSYQSFEKLLHNTVLLQNLVFQSKVLLNMIAILPLLQQDNSLHQQGTVFQNWLTTTFPEEFIYHSNHIEGSKIPKSEVANILQGKKLAYKVKNEVQEVKNSLQARTFLQSDFLWNIANIKKLYHILTKDLLQETGIFYPRGFKKVSIVVNNAATTDPQQVEKAVSDLLQMIKTQKKTLFPLQLAFDFHLKYEQIHPFENGNGRTGRFLMDKLLLQNGLLPMIVFKDNKEAYFNAIKKASESGTGRKAYYTFMVEQYQKTLELISPLYS